MSNTWITKAIEDEAAAILAKLDAPIGEARGPYSDSGIKKTGFLIRGMEAKEVDPAALWPAQPNRAIVRFEVLPLHRRHWDDNRIGALVMAVRAQVAALGYKVDDWAIQRRQRDVDGQAIYAPVVQKHGFEIILDPDPELVAAYQAVDVVQQAQRWAAHRAAHAHKVLTDVERAVEAGDLDMSVLAGFKNWYSKASDEAHAKTLELEAAAAKLHELQANILKVPA